MKNLAEPRPLPSVQSSKDDLCYSEMVGSALQGVEGTGGHLQDLTSEVCLKSLPHMFTESGHPVPSLTLELPCTRR